MINCEDIIKKALGRDLLENEGDEFLTQAEDLVKKLRAKAQADASLPDIVDLAKVRCSPKTGQV